MRRALAFLLLVMCAAPRVLGAQRDATDGRVVRMLRIESPVDGGEWEWALESDPSVRPLSAARGRASGAPVLVTLQLGTRLEAGRRTVGQVVFTRGAERRVVPLDVEIAARHALELHAAAGMAMADAGEDVALLFTVHNGGNAPDSIALALNAPGDWDAGIAGTRSIALAPGASAMVRVIVTPPVALTAGGTIVQLRAVGSAGTAEAQTIVEVGGSRREASAGALRVESSMSHLSGSGVEARNLATLAFAGPIAPGITLSGTIASPLGQGNASLVRGASTIGLPIMGSHLRIAGLRGGLELGRVAMRLPELAGRSIGGDGASFSFSAADARRSALTGAVVRDDAGALAQGALAWQGTRGPLSIDAAAAHLHMGAIGIGSSRELTALALGARLQTSEHTSLGVELADRQIAGGRALGVATDLRWEGEAGRASVRAQHAPGGASALALARDAINAESMLRVGEAWLLSGYGWYARDGADNVTTLSSMGGGLSPMRRIGASGELGAVLSASGYSSANGGTEQGTLDTELGLRAAGLVGGVRWEVDGVRRAQDRFTQSAALEFRDRADRLAVRSGLSMMSRVGQLALRGGFAAASATQASEASMEMQATELRPLRALSWFAMDVALQRSYLGVAAIDHARLTARAALPGAFTLQFGMEHERWHGTQVMPQRTSVAMRLSRSAAFEAADRWRTRTGMVFEDLNDDGVRDAGEPAVASITLRSGAMVMTSDRHGAFRLAVDADTPEIDVRTLRADQRPGRAARADRFNVPVRTVGRLEVAVRKANAVATRSSEPTQVIVITARSANGTEWRATLGRDGIARFDALPIGAYTISAAAVEAGVTLRVEEVMVRIERGSGLPGVVVPRLELVERDRPIRLQGGAAGFGVNSLLNTQMERNQQERNQQERNQQERQQHEREREEREQRLRDERVEGSR